MAYCVKRLLKRQNKDRRSKKVDIFQYRMLKLIEMCMFGHILCMSVFPRTVSVFVPLYLHACMRTAYKYFTHLFRWIGALRYLCYVSMHVKADMGVHVQYTRRGLCRLGESHYRAKKSKHLFSLLISLADIFSPVQPEVAPLWLISPSKRPPHLTTVHYLF